MRAQMDLESPLLRGLPVYNDKSGEIERYNIYKSVMLVRHAEDGKKYLYDFLSIKKETSSPLES